MGYGFVFGAPNKKSAPNRLPGVSFDTMRTLVAIWFFAALPAWTHPCDISPAAKAALNSQPASTVRDRFPRDYFVHSAYQDATWARGVSTPQVQAEYRALKDALGRSTLRHALRPRYDRRQNLRSPLRLERRPGPERPVRLRPP